MSHLIWGVANENRPYRNGGSCLLFVSNKERRRVYPLHVDQIECPKPRHNLAIKTYYSIHMDTALFFFIRAGFEYYLTQLSQDHFKNEQIKKYEKNTKQPRNCSINSTGMRTMQQTKENEK